MRADTTVERRAFEFKRCLGRGGFGEVYLASMTSAGGVRAEVAVKVLVEDLDVRSQAVQRLRDEGRLLGALNHPSILRVHDIVLLDGRVALVTEYVDGADLADLMTGDGRMPIRALTEVVARVADALHAAWTAPSPDGGELRLVHRDIKPQNIRIGRHGDVKVLDFGIAKATNEKVSREAHTQTNVIVGSLGFIAPERMFSDNAIEPAGDVFALGCVLYEGLSGEKFFNRLDEKRMYRLAVDSEEYDPFLEQRMARLKDQSAVAKLVAQMLRYIPAERPSAKEVATECEQHAEDLPGIGLKRWCRERLWPDPTLLAGPLDGRVITEATLARSTSTLAGATRPEAPAARSKAPLLAGGAVLLATIAAGAVALVLIIGVAAYELRAPPPAEPVPAPIASAPKPMARPVIGQKPATKAVDPAPTVAVAPPADPKPAPKVTVAKADPPKVTAPKDDPPKAPSGTVTVAGGIPVELWSADRHFKAGSVPVGRYEVRADFGSGMAPSGNVDVRAGVATTIRCSKLRQSCAVEGG